MSVSYQNRKKAKRKLRTPEQRRIDHQIRQGAMPAFHLARNGKDLERGVKHKGRWIVVKDMAPAILVDGKWKKTRYTFAQRSTRAALA